MGNYRPFLQGPLPVANYTRIIIPGRFWTRPPSTKSTRMASSATPLHDSLIELAIPDAHAHAIKWYLKNRSKMGVVLPQSGRGFSQFARALRARVYYESHYVPRSPATFDLALTPSLFKMRQAVHNYWMHQKITSAAGFGEQLNRTGMSAECDRRSADPI